MQCKVENGAHSKVVLDRQPRDTALDELDTNIYAYCYFYVIWDVEICKFAGVPQSG